MTLRRTGLTTRNTFRDTFMRDRTDGGGGGDTDDGEDDPADDMEMSDDGDDTDDDDGDDDDDDKPKGVILRRDGQPATQEDFDKLQEALRKERRKNRQRSKDGAGDKDADDAVTAERTKWTGVVVNTAARSALAESGLVLPADPEERSRAAKRALRLLDLTDVEVDEDGEVVGLEDAIADLKADYPELFKRRGGKIDGGDKDRGRQRRDTSKLSASEIQAMQLRGEL